MTSKPEKRSTGVSSAEEPPQKPSTKEERVLAAEEGQKLEDAPAQDADGINPLKRAVAFLCAHHKLNPPESVDWPAIEEWLRNGRYRNFTVEDLREAAFLHADGQIEEVPHYGTGVSTIWIRKILDAYSKLRGPLLNRKRAELAEKERGRITEEQKKENRDVLVRDIWDDFESTLKGVNWKKPWGRKYDILVHSWGVMPEPTSYEKNRAMDEAEAEVRKERKELVNPFHHAGLTGDQVKDRAKVICVRNFYQRLDKEGRHIKDVLNTTNPQPHEDQRTDH